MHIGELFFLTLMLYSKKNGISDHTRCYVFPSDRPAIRKNPFKFFNFLTKHPQFLEAVFEVWQITEPIHQSRLALYHFQQKLKLLKPILRALNKNRYGDIQKRTQEAFATLCEKQKLDLEHPSSETFAAVSEVDQNWHLLSSAEEQFFRQKSQITWLSHGNQNTTFFHQSVLQRAAQNSIRRLVKPGGEVLTDVPDIKREAAAYFQRLSQAPNDGASVNLDLDRLITYRCPPTAADSLVSPITEAEIKQVLSSM